MHKVFISYHHGGDASYKARLMDLNLRYRIFIDGSVDTGGIPDGMPDATVREIIRDNYLRDTTVTIVLVGLETRCRKHVDWETYSSMFDGKRNKKSGLIAITLPPTGCAYFTTAHDGEKEIVYPDNSVWTSIYDRVEYERIYPYMPDRIIDNLVNARAKISVTNWDRIESDPSRLSYLIAAASQDRFQCEYDLSRPMRRANS
ncbi:MAG TPA: TIR domain-containing protein [Thermoanaerobaculia bacterium]|jgi:hypothetical protein